MDPTKRDNKLPQNVQNIRKVINFIEKTMKTWEMELTAAGISLAEAKIQRGIFQEDALSPLLFIITIILLNRIIRKCTDGYKLSRLQEKIYHIMYMGDIKLFAKDEKELETLIHTVRIYNQDIGIEFGIKKCAMLELKSRKRHMTDGIELQNQYKIRTLGENETYKYLCIMEADAIKQVVKKEYLRRSRELLETKLSGRNLIKGINICAVNLVRYLGPFLKWTRKWFKQMDPRTRITSQRRRWQTIWIKKWGRKKTCQHWRQRSHIDKTTRGLQRKTGRSTDYRHLKRYWSQDC